MKEIVIISGKGGTGKSSICAAIAYLAKAELVVADCDVDAADLHLILHPENSKVQDFYSGVLAEIDPGKCSACGLCYQKCRFDAIEPFEGTYRVIDLECEGCGYCYYICPEDAISLIDQNVGKFLISDTRYGCSLVHAHLKIGADNSGKLVAKVKSEAKAIAKVQDKPYILADGSPGIGCPVIASLAGADYVILVTESSKSGLSDLKRVQELVAKFQIPSACIVNKADINPSVTNDIHKYLNKSKVQHLGDIPYADDFHKAIAMGRSLIEENEARWLPIFTEYWQTIKENI
ncbi:MAG: ATP-binding protein [Candidatus Cloacimonadaceae bacterium]|jgi:MinD superfamily P-loop ATPase|nr:ATP-binding protein [Candidatus Cloacimonadota bacterium]MDY0127602.1 ATP-binding protein [Candidatus Cloacimonadaceae bacterium]MCB5254870.1 ATP-binding protein [Candidatus Cloacimonadota bacterium]MCK9178782.1 ATP-binding protein [Candidatus Cloacimonadota bacterium]MCK9243610.1 ATP-binding protein [Candidatus Cloacimonadota bacterium]